MKFFKTFNESVNNHVITVDELKPILEAHQATNKPIYISTYPGSKVVFLIKAYLNNIGRELQHFSVHSNFGVHDLRKSTTKKTISPNAVFIFDEVDKIEDSNLITYIELSLETGFTDTPNSHWTILIDSRSNNDRFSRRLHDWFKTKMDYYEVVPPDQAWRKSKSLDDINNASGVFDK